MHIYSPLQCRWRRLEQLQTRHQYQREYCHHLHKLTRRCERERWRRCSHCDTTEEGVGRGGGCVRCCKRIGCGVRGSGGWDRKSRVFGKRLPRAWRHQSNVQGFHGEGGSSRLGQRQEVRQRQVIAILIPAQRLQLCGQCLWPRARRL
jgi:hypothetical protein